MRSFSLGKGTWLIARMFRRRLILYILRHALTCSSGSEKEKDWEGQHTRSEKDKKMTKLKTHACFEDQWGPYTIKSSSVGVGMQCLLCGMVTLQTERVSCLQECVGGGARIALFVLMVGGDRVSGRCDFGGIRYGKKKKKNNGNS